MKKEKTVEELFEEYDIIVPTRTSNRLASGYISIGDISWLLDLAISGNKHKKFAREIFPSLKFKRGPSSTSSWYYIKGKMNRHRFCIGMHGRYSGPTLDYISIDRRRYTSVYSKYTFMEEFFEYYDLTKRVYLFDEILEYRDKQKIEIEESSIRQLLREIFRKEQS